MNAIFGIINKNGKPVELARIDKIKDALKHRSVDGNGLWQSGAVALGFCKTIVCNRQGNEQLPFETDQLVFTADARIDNRGELYRLLDLDEKQFASFPDALIMVKAFERWGKDCVNYLEGEFAFAVWDKIRQKLLLYTDHVGFRPVYYHDGEDEFIFCSEIRGLVAAKTTPNYFDEDYLIAYFYRQADYDTTCNREVKLLLSGSRLSLQQNEVEIRKYWIAQPLGKYNFKKPADWHECFKHLLYQEIENRLDTDFNVGVSLSGGLDSSAVACIAASLLQKKNKPLYAFSSVLPLDHPGTEKDERRYIEIVNKHCPNIIQTFVDGTEVGPFERVEEVFTAEQHFPATFFYVGDYMARTANKKNVRIFLTGQGGDTWPSWPGHDVIYQLAQQGRLATAFDLVREFAHTEQKSITAIVLREYLKHTGPYNGLRTLYYARRTNWQLETGLRKEFAARYGLVRKRDNSISRSEMMIGQVNAGIIGKVNELYANRYATNGVEVAAPMLSRSIIEFMMDVPPELFVKNGVRRSLFRHAMEGVLPPEIQWRQDKFPMVPAYPFRLKNQRDHIFNTIEQPQYQFAFDRYLRKDLILKNFADLKPIKGFGTMAAVMPVQIAQCFIACLSLNSLRKQGYLFDK